MLSVKLSWCETIQNSTIHNRMRSSEQFKIQNSKLKTQNSFIELYLALLHKPSFKS